MVNVRAAANVATSAVNPNVAALVQISTGYTTAANGVQAPSYATPIPLTIQIQALSKKDVEHLDSLNISGAERAVYANMQLTAVDRVKQSGGDLITFTDPGDGVAHVWLVTALLEGFSTAGWSRAAITRQKDVVT